GPGAEVPAAAAAGAVLCIGDLQPGHPAVGQGADAAVEETLAAPPAATARAGGTLGGSPNPGDQVGEHGLCPRGDGEVATVCLRRRPPISQGQKSLRLRGRQSWWGSARSVDFSQAFI